jgi:hypothetical protein
VSGRFVEGVVCANPPVFPNNRFPARRQSINYHGSASLMPVLAVPLRFVQHAWHAIICVGKGLLPMCREKSDELYVNRASVSHDIAPLPSPLPPTCTELCDEPSRGDRPSTRASLYATSVESPHTLAYVTS